MESALREAAAARILIEDSRRGFEFIHDRLREALLKGLTDEQRVLIHARLATALEARSERSLDACLAVARHAVLGAGVGPFDRAFSANIRAGKRALRELSGDDAFPFLDQALQLARTHGFQLNWDHYEAYGIACVATGRAAEAKESLSLALSGCHDRTSRLNLNRYLVECYRTTMKCICLEAGEQRFGRSGPCDPTVRRVETFVDSLLRISSALIS